MRFLVCCTLMLLACGDDGSAADAALDTALADSGRDVLVRDRGPVCAVTCGPAEACCLVDGEPRCVDTRANDDNCGGCGIQCGLDFGRGEVCERQRCRCGTIDIGCRGDRASWCCPALRPDLHAYCANLEQDFLDCGACGASCDPARADRCDGGRCRCGSGPDACAGTRESTCCVGFVGSVSGCVDLGNDRDHCGACGNRCGFGTDCVDGLCVEVGRDAGTPVDAGGDGAIEGERDAGTDASEDGAV